MTVRERLQASLGKEYSFERELSGGGMAQVFLAQETALGRQVVVKTLPDDLVGSVNVDRFTREIQVAAQLQHPCIVPVLSAGIADGVPYYTMPYVAGKSLRARLTEGGELGVPDAIKALRDLASGLAYAHERGIVHRDIKPENVLLSDGYALITDFGVAKAVAASTSDPGKLTATGLAIGTPGYMSPEQLSGDPHIDHRVDIYAFGCVAYELLVGERPFAGRPSHAVTAAHMVETPDLVTKHRPSVPAPLSALIARCLEKRPADRPQTARELINELDAIATPGNGTTATTIRRSPSSRFVVFGAFTAIAIAAIVVVRRVRGGGELSDAAAKRVVVRTFANNTGDKSLDPIGPMAADWIARGLTETKSVDVAGTESEIVSPEDVRRNGGSLTATALGRLVRARYVISGSYFTQGDSVVLQAEVTDASAGRRVLAVPPVTDATSAKQAVLERLRQRVASALIPFFDSSVVTASRVPPSYEAYQEFLIGNRLYTSDRVASIAHLRAAVRLDTTFMWARLRLISQFTIQGASLARDSLIADVEAHHDLLSPYEAAAFALRVGLARGDVEAAYRAANDARRLAPSSAWAAYEAAEVAIDVGRVHEALELLEGLDPEAGVLRFSPNYYTFLCRSYHTLHRDRDLRSCYDRAARQYPSQMASLTRVWGVLGDERRVGQIVDSVVSAAVPSGPAVAAVFELDVHGHRDAARKIARRALAKAERPADDSAAANALFGARVSLLAFLGEWRRLAALTDSILARRPDPDIHGLRVIAAAMLGDTADARRRLAASPLDTLRSGNSRVRSARILAALGDKPGAVGELRRGLHAASSWDYHGDLLFPFLRGYAPFDAVVRPRD